MNTFKKLALVAAISAAPFAQAELVSMDDAVLGDMTGQAGISIDLSAEVEVGSVVYTDTKAATAPAAEIGGGTVGINTIKLGGAGGTAVTGALDGITIDIDVDDSDGLTIQIKEKVAGTAIDFGLSVADVNVNGSATNLASAIYLGGEIGATTVKIDNVTDAVTNVVSTNINVVSSFKVTEGELNVDVLGLGITGLTIDSGGQMASLEVDVAPTDNGKVGVAFGNTSLDIAMSQTLGGASLGHMAINGLELNNTSLVIYGH